jgi:NAD(P)-dependent dehydrogenase (short-subunit alcohol dehydrogenase family)
MTAAHDEHFMVIGGTGGIGRTLVVRLAESGRRVSLLGRHAPSELAQYAPAVHFQRADLADLDSARAAAGKCIDACGKISHLVFYQRCRGSGDSWEGEIQVSLTATKTLIELCADRFDGRSGNSIVIISSLASRFVFAEQPVSYHVAKAGMSQMVRYYAVSLAPLGIRVNAVSPGTIDRQSPQPLSPQQRAAHDLYQALTPLGRTCTAGDVANVVEFLCSPQAALITGQDILVDGGLSLIGHAALARRAANLDESKLTR